MLLHRRASAGTKAVWFLLLLLGLAQGIPLSSDTPMLQDMPLVSESIYPPGTISNGNPRSAATVATGVYSDLSKRHMQPRQIESTTSVDIIPHHDGPERSIDLSAASNASPMPSESTSGPPPTANSSARPSLAIQKRDDPGILACGPWGYEKRGDRAYFMSEPAMTWASLRLCHHLQDERVVFKRGDPHKCYGWDTHAAPGTPEDQVITAEVCFDDGLPDCPTTDFSQAAPDAMDACGDSLGRMRFGCRFCVPTSAEALILTKMCSKEGDTEYTDQWLCKEGGAFQRDCLTWAIGVKNSRGHIWANGSRT